VDERRTPSAQDETAAVRLTRGRRSAAARWLSRGGTAPRNEDA